MFRTELPLRNSSPHHEPYRKGAQFIKEILSRKDLIFFGTVESFDTDKMYNIMTIAKLDIGKTLVRYHVSASRAYQYTYTNELDRGYGITALYIPETVKWICWVINDAYQITLYTEDQHQKDPELEIILEQSNSAVFKPCDLDSVLFCSRQLRFLGGGDSCSEIHRQGVKYYRITPIHPILPLKSVKTMNFMCGGIDHCYIYAETIFMKPTPTPALTPSPVSVIWVDNVINPLFKCDAERVVNIDDANQREEDSVNIPNPPYLEQLVPPAPDLSLIDYDKCYEFY